MRRRVPPLPGTAVRMQRPQFYPPIRRLARRSARRRPSGQCARSQSERFVADFKLVLRFGAPFE
ncbi:hypothetical protein C6V04_02190 [Burkholderia multivorans]|nr:hypothetical protein C6V04_02190 [Burkholderia multivorans]